MATVIKDLGAVTAYAYAVEGGYTGTEEEFTELLGNIAIDLAEIENLSVTVTTLPAGSQATASYSDGVLSLGIPKGDKGDTGDTGATPAFSIGTVTTEAAGSPATATITGTAAAPILNLGIPKGADGDVSAASMATAYSTSATYAVGDYVWYSGQLYRCTTAITTAEAWTSGHWTAAKIAEDVGGLKSAVNNLGATTFSPLNFVSDGTGSINATDGSITSGSTYGHTDYIDLSGYERIQYNRIGTTNPSATSGMAFYDENKEYIGGEKIRTGQTTSGYVGARTLIVPTGAKYARFTFYLDTETRGEFWVNGEYALVYKTDDLRPSPSQVLMDEILVPDFGPTSVSSRTIYKRGNSIYLSKSSNNTASYTFSISGDEMRVQSVTDYSYHVPNIGNLVPVSKANSLRLSLKDKPTADSSSYASYIVFTFYTVEGEGDEAVITRVVNRSITFNSVIDKTCVLNPPPSNATHFEIVIYSRRSNYLPSDSYCRFTFDFDCETGEDDRLNGIRGMISDDVETSGVASKSYAVGDLLAWGNDLYVATAAIATGETLVTGTNITPTTIAAQIAALRALINS